MTRSIIAITLGILLFALAGCPQPIEIAATDQRADAAVAPMPPRTLCKHEPREVAKIAATQDRLLVDFVRDRDESVLISVVSASTESAAKVRLDAINRSGAANRIAEIEQTGPAADVLGLSAVLSGGEIHIALTRPEGHVDVITLDTKGAPQGDVRSLEFGATSKCVATLHSLSSEVLLTNASIIKRLDGTDFQLTSDAAGDAGPTSDGGPLGADAGLSVGDAASNGLVTIPDGVTSFVVAGDSLGWIRSTEDGVFLEHHDGDSGETLSAEVAAPGHDVRALWAGDRYLVGDAQGADLARFVLDRPARRNSDGAPRLRLGGRMSLPRPPAGLHDVSWHNAGARHVGLARQIGPRRLEFVNVALGGLIFDAVATIETETDIVGSAVIWDGRGYVLAWATRAEDNTAQLHVTRFSCPDDQ